MGSTSTSKSNSAVVDNNILVDLWELGRMDILFKSFENVLIPEIIYNNELPIDVKEVIDDFSYKIAIIETEVGYEIYYELTASHKYRNLSRPDKIAVSIAKQEAVFCTSNDGLVRKACVEYEIQFLGILGVLNHAYKKEILSRDEMIALSRNLLETSCYITEEVIECFLENL